MKYGFNAFKCVVFRVWTLMWKIVLCALRIINWKTLSEFCRASKFPKLLLPLEHVFPKKYMISFLETLLKLWWHCWSCAICLHDMCWRALGDHVALYAGKRSNWGKRRSEVELSQVRTVHWTSNSVVSLRLVTSPVSESYHEKMLPELCLY